MSTLIGWGSASIVVAALAGLVACVVTIVRHDCCDHPDLDDVELVLP